MLLQNVMTKEDFSKYEKLVLPPPPNKEEKKKLREEELWRQCQKEESLKKQVQMHLEQVKKHEHTLEQQNLMLADVQLQLESVSLEVKALRALVAETKEPEGPPVQAPLPAPREPPPDIGEHIVPSLDLEMEATPLDSDDDGMEDRDAGSWLTVASNRKKRGKAPVVMKLKGSSASVRNGSLRPSFVDKTCIFENDMSGVEVGKALLKLSPNGLQDIVSTLPPGAIDQFMSFSLVLRRYTKFNRAPQVPVRLKRFVGNASSFSNGIQAKRVSFNDPCAEISVPQSAKPGLFSGEPASFFTGCERLPGMVDPRNFFLSLFLMARLFLVQVMWNRFLDAGKRGPPAVSRWNLQLPGWRLIGWTRRSSPVCWSVVPWIHACWRLIC